MEACEERQTNSNSGKPGKQQYFGALFGEKNAANAPKHTISDATGVRSSNTGQYEASHGYSLNAILFSLTG